MASVRNLPNPHFRTVGPKNRQSGSSLQVILQLERTIVGLSLDMAKRYLSGRKGPDSNKLLMMSNLMQLDIYLRTHYSTQTPKPRPATPSSSASPAQKPSGHSSSLPIQSTPFSQAESAVREMIYHFPIVPGVGREAFIKSIIERLLARKNPSEAEAFCREIIQRSEVAKTRVVNLVKEVQSEVLGPWLEFGQLVTSFLTPSSNQRQRRSSGQNPQ